MITHPAIPLHSINVKDHSSEYCCPHNTTHLSSASVRLGVMKSLARPGNTLVSTVFHYSITNFPQLSSTPVDWIRQPPTAFLLTKVVRSPMSTQMVSLQHAAISDQHDGRHGWQRTSLNLSYPLLLQWLVVHYQLYIQMSSSMVLLVAVSRQMAVCHGCVQ